METQNALLTICRNLCVADMLLICEDHRDRTMSKETIAKFDKLDERQSILKSLMGE